MNPYKNQTRLTLLEGVVDVEQREVVTVYVSEPHLGLVGRLLGLGGPHEALRDWAQEQRGARQTAPGGTLMAG